MNRKRSKDRALGNHLVYIPVLVYGQNGVVAILYVDTESLANHVFLFQLDAVIAFLTRARFTCKSDRCTGQMKYEFIFHYRRRHCLAS